MAVSSLYGRIRQSGQLPPLPAFVPQKEADNPADPVQNHGDPHADRPVPEINSDEITESDPEDKHGGNGYHHGILHIIAGPEHIGEGKGQGPEQTGASIVNEDKRPRQICCLGA